MTILLHFCANMQVGIVYVFCDFNREIIWSASALKALSIYYKFADNC